MCAERYGFALKDAIMTKVTTKVKGQLPYGLLSRRLQCGSTSLLLLLLLLQHQSFVKQERQIPSPIPCILSLLAVKKLPSIMSLLQQAHVWEESPVSCLQVRV